MLRVHPAPAPGQVCKRQSRAGSPALAGTGPSSGHALTFPATPRHQRLQNVRSSSAWSPIPVRVSHAVPASRACDTDPGKDTSCAAAFSRYLPELRLRPRCRARRSGSRRAESHGRCASGCPYHTNEIRSRDEGSRCYHGHDRTVPTLSPSQWPNLTGLTIVLQQGRLGHWFAEAGGSD